MPLSDRKIRQLQQTGKAYKVSDGHGLYVQVSASGSRLWRMNYSFNGKQKTLSLGTYPEVTLLNARVERDKAKLLLSQGIDPSAAKRGEANPEPSAADTFETVADRWFRVNDKKWVSAYAIRLRNRMTSDVYPSLGSKPINAVVAKDVLATIRKVEERGAIEMGRRIAQMVSQVFRFAISEGLLDTNPARDIGGALAPKPAPKRRSSIPQQDLPALMESIKDYPGDPVTAAALRFVIHTFVRTNELRHAEWTEFEDLDGDGPLWRIPAEKMKMRRGHIVPLSRQAVSIVKGLKPITGNSRYLFPSPNSNSAAPISANTMIYGLYRLGFHSRATVHGFRHLASTVLNENEFNRDWVELQLAHVDASVRGVYNSALYLAQRRKMMQWWSDFVELTNNNPDILNDLL